MTAPIDAATPASTGTPASPPDDVARRVRRRRDNRPGGADYVQCEGQLSIYDVPGVHPQGEGPAGSEGVAQP
jgi:hypothetical protein